MCAATAVCCNNRVLQRPGAAKNPHPPRSRVLRRPQVAVASRVAMPPKAKMAARALAPKLVQESMLVKIDDVSTEEDSGWRAVDAARVAELVHIFRAGDFGMNILRKPSVLYEGGNPKLASNGKMMLSDGKATFVALAEIAVMMKEDGEKDEE